MATNKEDEARLGFESQRSNFEVNYSFIYPSAADIVGKEFQAKIGWARYPRTDPGKPSRPPIGGINLGIGAYSKNKDLAFDAATCLALAREPARRLREGRPAPHHRVGLQRPQAQEGLPVRRPAA